ncbi:MAG: hypothetical protein ABW061_06760 [Polyangiaceae bacterium]
MAALPVVAAACGDSSGGTPAGGGMGGPGGMDPLITIQLPPEVESRAKKLIDDLSAIICQRSQNCCASYGFRPLTDCKEAAAGPLFLSVSQVLFDGADNFDYAIDEALATACLGAARSVMNDCTFATEPLTYAWATPCADALRVTKKGEVPSECRDDIECQARLGLGHRCYDDKCLSLAEVPTGSSCAAALPAASIPVCTSADYCSPQSVCARRSTLGEECQGKGTCVEPYACAYREPDDGGSGRNLCVDKVGLNARCVNDEECSDGWCACSPDVGCAKYKCLRAAQYGDPCKTVDDCYGLLLPVCTSGRCQPAQISICQ